MTKLIIKFSKKAISIIFIDISLMLNTLIIVSTTKNASKDQIWLKMIKRGLKKNLTLGTILQNR